VLFFDSNKNFHAHPNNEIGNGGHFLSILDLEFSVQFISEQRFLHPNRPLGYLRGWKGIIFVSRNFPDRLFTSPGFEGIIPGYPHKSHPL
jgi:hypothetical protein